MLRHCPDEALDLLASMVTATDRELRAVARALAGRMLVDVARHGPLRRRKIGRLATVPWRGSGDLDVDASLDAIFAARATTSAVTADDLRARDWAKPAAAWCLLVDRSGSMTGRPLAVAAVAAAAVALRNPDDFSVLSFARDVVAVKSQDVPAGVEWVVDGVLALRGHGTTDVAGALDAARRQLARSTAARRIAVLLSDCRATEPGDVVGAAMALDELVVIAPGGDDGAARTLAAATGGRVTTVSGASDLPAALARVVD